MLLISYKCCLFISYVSGHRNSVRTILTIYVRIIVTIIMQLYCIPPFLFSIERCIATNPNIHLSNYPIRHLTTVPAHKSTIVSM